MAIHKKLLNIMSKIERVPKNGFNAFHKYRFVQDTDLTEYVRKFLVEEGVMVLPSVESQNVMPQASKEGETYLTIVNGSITFVDTEDSSSVVVKCQGQGQDKGDKGVYKAMTGFMKYGMMKVFMVPTGDDPEHDEEPKPAKSQKPAAVPPADKPDWTAFTAAYKAMGYTKEEVIKIAGTSKFDNWTKDEADELLMKLRDMKKEEGAA